MPSYGQSFSAVYPTIGQPGATEAVDLNTLLLNIVTCLEAKVSPSGININAELEMNGNVLSELDQLKFQGRAALSSGSGILFWNSSDNELYWRSSGGVNVKLTNGGAINVAATGAITGAGYGSGGVEVNWDSANLRYKLKDASGTDAYAHVAVDDVQLNDGSGNFLSLAAPAMAGDYTVTFPNAVPSATARLIVSTGGALSYETAAESINIHAFDGSLHTGGPTIHANGYVQANAGADAWQVPFAIPVGYRIKSVTGRGRRAGGTITYEIKKVDSSTGGVTSLGTATVSSGTSDHTALVDFADEIVGANILYWMTFTSGANLDRFYGITIAYDKVIA